MKFSLRCAACSLALFGSAGLTLAQETAQPTPRARQQQREPAGQAGEPGQFGRFGQPRTADLQLEPSIVTLLIIDNNKEIALGRLGQQTSQNEHVKHFCEMIVKDHSSFVQKLQAQTAGGVRAPALGFEAGADRERGALTPPPRPTSPTADAQPDPTKPDVSNPFGAPPDRNQPVREQESDVAATQEREPRQQNQETRTTQPERGESGLRITVAKPVIGNQPGAALLQLHHELAEACLESARSMAQKPGPDFDMHFMGAQIVAHQAMLDKLQVFQRHVSPETKQLLTDAQGSVQKHLKEAQSIHAQLSQHGNAEGAETRRGERTKTRPERE